MKLKKKDIVIGDYKKERNIGMKILHINSYYSVSRFYKNLYDEQLKSGLDIDVFVPVSFAFRGSEADFGRYTTLSSNHTKYDRLLFHLKHNKIYKDIVRKYDIGKYSIIHAHSLFSNGYIAMKLKQQFGVSYIVAVRNTDVNLFFKQMVHLRKMGIEILENADRVVFLSNSYKDSVIRDYVPKFIKKAILDKSVIIPNGIDEFWFDNIAPTKQKPKKSFLNLLQIGDINKNKNIETTVKAIKLLIGRGYNIKLDVVGKVKDQKVFDKIKDKDFVNYLGYKSKEELIHVYRNNDIFVMPSKHETFGLVYVEAMSQGVPVIYTKGQGFYGQFDEGVVGFSTNCFDEIEIANKIIAIVQDFESLSTNSKNSIYKFKWSNISKQYYDLYSNITGEDRFNNEIDNK